MLLDLSKRPVPFSCGQCGHKDEKTLAWLKFNLEFPCAGCGATIQVDRANIDAAIRDLEAAEKTVNDAHRDLLSHFNRRPKR